MTDLNPGKIQTTRRTLLAAGGAGLTGIALAGCGNSGSNNNGTAPSVDAKTVLPTYAGRTLATPTKKGDGQWVEDLYLSYPSELVQSVKETPGKGSTFNITTCYWANPINKSGSYYKAMEKALGATVTQNDVSSTDYTTKLTAMLAAGKNLPDVMSCFAWDYPPKLNDALNSAFLNLTDVLGGDKVKDYPNLANLPTPAWKNGLWSNQLYSYPGYMQHSIPLVPMYRKDLLDKVGISEIKGKDGMLAMCKAVTNASQKTYALTANLKALVLRFMYGMYFDGMDTDSSGKVQMYWERDDYPDALNFMRTLAASYVHPDLLAGTGDQQALFKGGKVAMIVDGTEAFLSENSTLQPQGKSAGFLAKAWLPTDPKGGTSSFPAGPPVMFANFISKSVTGDRLKELLRILDYLAAPFGTKEYELTHYGTEGVDFKRVNGAPNQRAASFGDAFTYTAAAPIAIAAFNDAGNVKTAQEYYDWQTQMSPRVKFVKTTLVHPKLPTNLENWMTDMNNLEDAIVKGHKPVSALDSALKTWKSKYGDKVRDIYQNALASSPIQS